MSWIIEQSIRSIYIISIKPLYSKNTCHVTPLLHWWRNLHMYEILADLKILREWCPCLTDQTYFSYWQLFMFLLYKSQTMHIYLFFIILIDELTYI